MDSCSKTRFGGKRISVSWDETSESANGWFSCEFSWHPRILVVANNEAIYVLDLRFGKCQHTCLLRLYCKRAETLREREKERIIFISINLCVFLNISFTTIYINQFCYYNATSFLSVMCDNDR